ncbi:protein NEN4 [Apium graveolens]|uniref:protein NEN4 n=1 Tax=Apium graveolens TaxID=4045 RepID=UPI003D7B7006
MADSNSDVTEIVFFDLETNVPKRIGEKFWVLEFGAIVVCPRTLVELDSYVTLIKPGDLSVVALRPGRCGAITRQAVSNAPCFEEVADKIFEILDGRVWAGHNIQRFDCVRIKEAFASIGRPAPVPVGMIDSLGVLTQKFGRRAGNMKMASLATYFGLGQQKHRSLDDVRMNLEVLKHCATVLFLESSLPSILLKSWHDAPTVQTRSRSLLDARTYNSCSTLKDQLHNSSNMITTRRPSSDNGKLQCKEENSRKSPPTTALFHQQRPFPYSTRGSIRKVTERVKINHVLSNILKHSHLLR